MEDYTEVIKGRIVSKSGGTPVNHAEVEVWDKDLLMDDYLGTALTDEDGRFEVPFTWSQYKDSVFEGRPDIFLKVRNPNTGKTTKTEVYYELSGEVSDDDSEEVMDLGEIKVE